MELHRQERPKEEAPLLLRTIDEGITEKFISLIYNEENLPRDPAEMVGLTFYMGG